jgi:osmotically-inducible protein OsmY
MHDLAEGRHLMALRFLRACPLVHASCAATVIVLAPACATSPRPDPNATSVTRTTSAPVAVVVRSPLEREIVNGHDVGLARRVGAMLTADPAQKYSDIRISATPGGTVTLTGTVTTVRARRNIHELIGLVPGVAIVVDDLVVDARAKAESATSLVPNVLAQLEWDPRLDGRRVHVDATRDGKVALYGRLASESQRDAAIDDAERAGATEVEDFIEVIPGAPPLNPR